MNVIITGGAGFIGSNLAHFLSKKKNIKKIIIIDNLSTGIKKNLPKNVIFVKKDISKNNCEPSIKKHISNCDFLFHFAAQSSGENSFYNPKLDVNYNILGTLKTLYLCKKYKIHNYVFASSMSVYGDKKSTQSIKESSSKNPKSMYGLTKFICEKMIIEYCSSNNINFNILRLFNVYGPRQDLNNTHQGMLSIYLSFLLNKEQINIKGSTLRVRDFLYIDDLIRLLWIMINSRLKNKTYNIGTGKKTKVKDLIKLLLISTKNKNNYPINILKGTPGDVKGFVSNIDLIKKDYKWNPNISLSQGIKKMVKFYK